MKDHMSRQQVLLKRQLSTIFEWKEDEQAARQENIHQGTSVLRRSLTVDELKDSGAHNQSTCTAKLTRNRAKFAAVLQAASAEYSSESPLWGTPWEDAGLHLASSQRKNGHLRQQRSEKEQECIDFWLNFFG